MQASLPKILIAQICLVPGLMSAPVMAADFDEGLLPPPALSPLAPAESSWLIGEPLGAEDFSAEDDSPRIPEPLVFDLVRPLGARRGELEINTLALIPLNRQARLPNVPDPIGLEPGNRPRPEWAPEIEYAPFDNFAVEFELPFEDATLAAYKLGVQYTFGTSFDNRFIHGTQGLLLYDKHSGNWSPTLLYVAGLRIDERWSVLGMFGFRTEIGADEKQESTERLLNTTLFYDLNPHVTLGVETNWSQSLQGEGAQLVTPQVHWEITDHWMLQSGFGVNFSADSTLPEFAIRLIRSY